MNNVLHNNNWNLVAVQVHVEPPPILLMKSNDDDNLDKDCIKIGLCRDSTSKKLYPC